MIAPTVARAFAVCALVVATAFPAVAQDRHVKVVNKTGVTMVSLYGSNVGSDSWEEDILGGDELRSGQSVNVNFDDGTGYCKYDLKAVFADGDKVIKRGINVCTVGTWTIN
ncbi:MAG: hypothetical protein GC186_07545 [Rhodobacteraceae bacterium]|nr:hypothetical protein [Paracoccaceae bacterium]